jgi:hypothetical protein
MFESIGLALAQDDAPIFEPPWWLDAALPDEPWTDADALEQALAGPVGLSHLAHLMEIDAASLTADAAVTFAQEVDRFAAFAAGLQAQTRASVAARLVEDAGADAAFVTPQMLASAELAAALRLSPRSMDAQLELAAELAGPMAPLRDALLAGRISAGHAAAISRELNRVPMAHDSAQADAFAAVCDRILTIVVPHAESHTPGQSARRTRMLIVAADPSSLAEQRRNDAQRDHGVWLTPTDSGSCEFLAVMPIAHGLAMFDAVNALAQHDKFETSDGCITAGQRRVAALATLVLEDPSAAAAAGRPVAEAKVNARVNVLVPLASLVDPGVHAQGGTIGGEPVLADVIVDLLAQAGPVSTLRRLVIDQEGCVIDAGRARYAISDVQRSLIDLRDGTCRFPGCTRRASRCEVDHATAWDDGGHTDLANLGALCKHHHQLKTHGGWRITGSVRSGACTWRSPLGRVYEHRPPPLVPPGAETVPQHSIASGDAEPPPF